MAQPTYALGRNRQQIFTDYEAYVAKFNDHPHTTDDTFTPPEVYEALLDWALTHQLITPDTPIIRPFWPGADYQAIDYPQGSIVIDNPPFSILAQIIRYYQAHHITYLLFAPSLTSFFYTTPELTNTTIITNTQIRYANGATVNTAFQTNHPRLTANIVITAPDLHQLITGSQKRAAQSTPRATLPKYTYPDHLITSAMLHRISHHIPFSIPRDQAHRITALDSQRPLRKAIFGKGLLISDQAAAQFQAAQAQAAAAQAQAAAAKAAATITFPLSDQEQEIIKRLSQKHKEKLV